MQNFNIYNLNKKISSKFPEFIKSIQLPKNKTIFLISPHSDDIAVACGGTVHLLSKTNKIIPLLFFTGYRGVEKADKKTGTKIREKEMQKEARVLGIQKPFFLRLSSYERNDKMTLKSDILKIKNYLQKYQPDIIFLPDENDLQPRHSLASQMTVKAICKLSEKTRKKIFLFFYETPWSIFKNLDFNTAFLLSKNNFQTKVKAIREHKSQIKRTAFDKIAQSLNTLRASIIPEQRIGYYGSKTKSLGEYLEVFMAKSWL